MSSGMSNSLKEKVLKYIDVCKRIHAAQLPTTTNDYCDAGDDFKDDLVCWDGLSEHGWTAEERGLCMQLLEADALVNPDVYDRIYPYFVVADASLFKAATQRFGKEYDMLGAMLEYADGIENLLSIVLLCAKLNIQPFRSQDVRRHMHYLSEKGFVDFDDADQALVRAWYGIMCNTDSACTLNKTCVYAACKSPK
jgi:hypothetical protein